MLTKEITYYPESPLNQFIDCIWVSKGQNINISSFHHAPLFTELIFAFSGEFVMKGQEIQSSSTPYYTYTLSGLKTNPFETINQGNYDNVGLILKPFCYQFLVTAPEQWINQFAEILYTHICIKEAPNFEPIIQFLEQKFTFLTLDPDIIKFQHFISTSELKKGRLAYFNDEINTSQKSFIQKFKNQYTLTPGKYIQLVQVNRAIKLLKKNTRSNLTMVGLDAGFYDQAHFIRVFKTYTGVTPKNFINPISE